MSMKLYVDDLRQCPEGWQLARTVTEAIRILDTQRVTHVSLDHDISHGVEVNGLTRLYPCGETFEPVARFIGMMVEASGEIGPQVTLHTANPVGAEKMRSILAGYRMPVTIQLGRPENGLEKEAVAGEGG